MKFTKIVLLIIVAFPYLANAYEISPKWNENDELIYNIEFTDERPPKNNNRWITQSFFKASLKILKKTNESYVLEWKYLPVKDPIVKCPFPNKDSCYSYNNDIKQSLKLIFNATIEGAYESVGNPEEIVEQIGKIFDAYISNNKNYVKWDKESINRLKESVLYDDSIVSELLEYHSIYGNIVTDGKFDKDSRIIQSANQSMSKYSSKIYEKENSLIVEYQMIKDFTKNPQGHLIEGKYEYRWVLNKQNMIIELEKKVKLETKEGIRKFALKFSRII
jgi:hypothetical protein